MNNKGFTIAEVMIAMVICGMTLMAATSMLVTTIKLNTTGNMQTMAINYARDALEECTAIGSRNLNPGTYEDTPHVAFTRRVVITETDKPTMKRVVVIIFYKKKRFIINANIGIHNNESWDDTDWEAWKEQYHVVGLN